jgi:DNA phosphorothioation-dependent restriction protein DptG
MRTFTCRSTFLYAMQVVCKKMSSESKGSRGESGLKLQMKDLPRLNELFCRRVTFLAKHAHLAEMKLFCRLSNFTVICEQKLLVTDFRACTNSLKNSKAIY